MWAYVFLGFTVGYVVGLISTLLLL
jgi:hypothetical protein